MRENSMSFIEERNHGRRTDDSKTRDDLRRHQQIFHAGQIITSETNLDDLFDVIVEQTVRIMDAERCSLFLYDEKDNQLWSLVATELKKNEIRFSTDTGVAGWVFRHREPLLIDDAYTDDRFNPRIDRQTGYKTRNIICIPLVNRQDTCIGTIELLNKRDGPFMETDLELLTSISCYVAIALENSKLFEELKLLDETKKKAIDHLAHELKMPLAGIVKSTDFIFSQLEETEDPEVRTALDGCQRHLERLLTLEAKIDDFLDNQPMTGPRKVFNFIEEPPCVPGCPDWVENGQRSPLLVFRQIWYEFSLVRNRSTYVLSTG
jgi:signal transduction protein with GAF and PtsI domain